MAFLSLLVMLAVPQQAAPAPDHFCTGLARIELKPGDELAPEDGPDFRVYYVTLADGTNFGVYDGNFAQVSGGEATLAFERGGLKLNRMKVDGVFRGYLVVDRQGEQNHFFGSVFKGDKSDAAFFDRVPLRSLYGTLTRSAGVALGSHKVYCSFSTSWGSG